MEWFDILIGISSIGSFIIALIALFKVEKIEKHIIKDNSSNISQSISNAELKGSNVNQAGRDIRGD